MVQEISGEKGKSLQGYHVVGLVQSGHDGNSTRGQGQLIQKIISERAAARKPAKGSNEPSRKALTLIEMMTPTLYHLCLRDIAS